MKTRLMLLTTNLARGGAETQVAMLAERLARRGWDVNVVSLVEPTAFTRELAGAGVPVYRAGVARLPVVLQKLRPHILHCHMFHANALGRVARLLAPVPIVISTLHSVQETSREGRGGRLRDMIYRFTDPLADATVAVCRAVAGRHVAARAVARHRMRVISNGVDTARFEPDDKERSRVRRSLNIGEGEFVWLAVGRLMWKKDYATMLQAFASAGRGVLLIAGEGPDEPTLRSLISELNANVRLLGVRADVPALMRAADMYLLSSVVEGLPVTLIEAASSGLPAVATDVGGVREIVVHGETGYVVPPSDPGAFASAMRSAMEAHRAMGQAARARAAGFSIESTVAQWEALYEELLQRC